MAEYERDFKGVWIPKLIWLDERLNALDKVILTEIDSLDNGERGCYASNQHIAKFCQCSETKVSTAISKLIKLGYVYVQKFDGRQRELKSRLSFFERQNPKNCKADIKELKESNTSINTNNNPVSKERGNTDCQQVVDLYTSICVSFPAIRSLTESRKKAIKARLNTYTLDDFRTVFENAEASSFLKGGNDRNWSANFDWLIKDSNMAKVLEGNYADKPKQTRYTRKEPIPGWYKQPELGDAELDAIKRLMESESVDNNPAIAEEAEAMQKMLQEKYGRKEA